MRFYSAFYGQRSGLVEPIPLLWGPGPVWWSQASQAVGLDG